MKAKSNFLRMMLVLVVAFLGGQLNAFAAWQPWVKYDANAKTLTFYYSNKSSLGTNEFNLGYGDLCPFNTGNNDTKYIRSSVEKVVFDKSFVNARPTSCSGWFDSFRKLKTIEGLNYLNTSEVTTMRQMFYYCDSLTSVDLTNFDTRNVKNMYAMFAYSDKFKSLDLSSFNTQNVTNMESMFSNCRMLETIYVSSTFVVDNVTESGGMFWYCNKIKGEISFNSNFMDKTYATANGGYFLDKTKFRPWVKYADGILTFQYGHKYSLGDNEYLLNTDKNKPDWESQTSNVTKVVFDKSFADVRPTSCYYWLHGCEQLTSDNIIGLNYLNTSEVKYLRDMFWDCTKLTTLDLSSFNTEKCEDMAGMFRACSGLTSLNISSFKTDNVKDIIYMFSGCSALKSLNLSKFNTEKITSMSRLFENCSSLDSLNISGFNTANVTSAPSMFNGCSNLKTIDVSSFNTAKMDNMGHMFANCSSLTTLDLTKFNTSAVKWIDNMFKNCSNLTTIYVSENFALSNAQSSADMFVGCEKLVGDIAYDANTVDKTYAKVDGGYFSDKVYTRPWVTYADGTLTFNYGYKKTLTSGSEFLLNTDTNAPEWQTNNPNVTKVVFNNTFAATHPQTCYYWFDNCNNLTSENIIGLNYLNTDEVTNMGHMFANCSSLTTLDLSNVNTSSVKWIDNMFKDCSNLTTIYASDKFVLENDVQNSADMFAGCEKLMGEIAYDANCVDKTYAKVDGGYFFNKAYLRPWVTYADGTLTFNYGYKKSLDNEEYALNEAWDDPAWENKNSSVTKVVFDNSFAYARPTTCYCWFAYCENLADIEGIENLNTSESTVLHLMFYHCDKLTSLDLSNFDTRKVTNMNWMFQGCRNLKYIYVSDKFVGGSTEKFAPSSSVFYCSPEQYNTIKGIAAFADYTVKPYVNINANAEYGTICVPLGSSLAEGSFSGFDKLYTIKSADKDKGTITMEEATTIEPGVAYVYRRNLPEGDTESIITFDADNSATATEPMTDGSLLKGTFSRITAPGGCYILQSDGNFHPVAADNTTLGVGAYKAYLDLSSLAAEGEQAKNYRMVFEDKQATGIKGVNDQIDQQSTAYFDLMGRKVETPKAGGIYVVNGKKVVCGSMR